MLLSSKTDAKPKRSSSSVQDHLASERTYMSWMRTAIALMGFGVFILRLRATQSPDWSSVYGLNLGFFFAIAGILTVSLSTWHYFTIRNGIEQDTYQPATRSVIFFSSLVTLLGLGIIYLIGISIDDFDS